MQRQERNLKMDNNILSKLDFLKENCKSGYEDIYNVLEYTIKYIENAKSALSEEMNTQAEIEDDSSVTQTNAYLTLSQSYIQYLKELEEAFGNILDILSDEEAGILKSTKRKRKSTNS